MRLRSLAGAIALFGLNLYICWGLWRIEYSAFMGSIEAAYVSISRQLIEQWRDFSWFPLWYAGIPGQNTYPPLLHWVVALVASLRGFTPAHAHHWTTTVIYCLGPVTLYWLLLRLSGSRITAFAAALIYSAISPSSWLMRSVAEDMGGMLDPRRLQALVQYGEGPHITALTLIPVALLALHSALTRKAPWRYALAAVSFAAVALANWIGAFALALALLAYLNARAEWTRDLPRLAGIAALAYALAWRWIPPSTIAVVQGNAKRIGGDFSHTYRSLPLWGVVLFGGLLLLRHLLRKTPLEVRFSAGLAWLMSVPPLAAEWTGLAIVPQPARYHLEMEMALALLMASGGAMVCRRVSRRTLQILAVLGVLLLIGTVKSERRFARNNLIRGIEITQTSEWKTAQWLNANWKGGRVLVPGSSSFWLNAFSDTPQIGGGFDQGTTLDIIPIALYQIYSGEAAGSQEAEFSVLWLKAMGVEAVGVSGPGSTEVFQAYRHPEKFEGVLEPLWRDGGDVLYRVSSAGSPAHVVGKGDLVQKTPINGIDVDPLRPYVAAIENPAYAPATLRWTARHSVEIHSQVAPGQVLSIQVSYHSGWRAWINGQPIPILRDALGFMYIDDPAVFGDQTLTLNYSFWR